MCFFSSLSLYSDWFSLSLDNKTANKQLWIREDSAKVARMTNNVNCPVLERPERYEYVPQVQYEEKTQSVFSQGPYICDLNAMALVTVNHR